MSRIPSDAFSRIPNCTLDLERLRAWTPAANKRRRSSSWKPFPPCAHRNATTSRQSFPRVSAAANWSKHLGLQACPRIPIDAFSRTPNCTLDLGRSCTLDLERLRAWTPAANKRRRSSSWKPFPPCAHRNATTSRQSFPRVSAAARNKTQRL